MSLLLNPVTTHLGAGLAGVIIHGVFGKNISNYLASELAKFKGELLAEISKLLGKA